MGMAVEMDFGSHGEEEGFLALQGYAGGNDYPRRIFGVVPGGFLVGKDQKKKFTSILYTVQLLPWDEIERVQIRRAIAVWRILGGVLSLGFGIFLAYVTWSSAGGSPWRMIEICVVAGVVGAVLLSGWVCSRIEVTAKSAKDGRPTFFTWVSPPAGYRKTLPHCAVALRYAREAGFDVTAHIDDDGAELPPPPPPARKEHA